MTATPQAPLRVFVVENHASTLKYYKMFLELEGHQVFHAATMTETLAAFPAHGCEVLISDMGLPDGTGWELLRRLRESGHAPHYAIAVSGYGTSADRARSVDAGFRHHLLKPFNPEELGRLLIEAAQEIRAGQMPGEANQPERADGG